MGRGHLAGRQIAPFRREGGCDGNRIFVSNEGGFTSCSGFFLLETRTGTHETVHEMGVLFFKALLGVSF